MFVVQSFRAGAKEHIYIFKQSNRARMLTHRQFCSTYHSFCALVALFVIGVPPAFLMVRLFVSSPNKSGLNRWRLPRTASLQAFSDSFLAHRGTPIFVACFRMTFRLQVKRRFRGRGFIEAASMLPWFLARLKCW